MNNIQREITAKYLVDISKIVATIFIVSAFVPNSQIILSLVVWAIMISFGLYILAMRILRGVKK